MSLMMLMMHFHAPEAPSLDYMKRDCRYLEKTPIAAAGFRLWTMAGFEPLWNLNLTIWKEVRFPWKTAIFPDGFPSHPRLVSFPLWRLASSATRIGFQRKELELLRLVGNQWCWCSQMTVHQLCFWLSSLVLFHTRRSRSRGIWFGDHLVTTRAGLSFWYCDRTSKWLQVWKNRFASWRKILLRIRLPIVTWMVRQNLWWIGHCWWIAAFCQARD